MKHWLKIIVSSLLAFAVIGVTLNLAGCGSDLVKARDSMYDARAVYVQQLADAELAGDTDRATKIRGVIEGLDKGLLLVNQDGTIDFAQAASWLPPPWNNIALIAGPILGILSGFGAAKKIGKPAA